MWLFPSGSERNGLRNGSFGTFIDVLDRLILQEKTQVSIKTKITLKVDVTSCQSPLW